MRTDASTETSSANQPAVARAGVPGPRPPRPGETASEQTGAFTGLVTALRSVTAPRPLVPAPEAAPSGSRLLGVCVWAAALALAGVLVGICGLVALVASHPGHWYLPALLISGAAGIALTAAAFLTVRQEQTPWVLLSGGTAALLTAAVCTAIAA